MRKAMIIDVLDSILLSLFAVSWALWIFYPLTVWGVTSLLITIAAFYFVHWKSRYWTEEMKKMGMA